MFEFIKKLFRSKKVMNDKENKEKVSIKELEHIIYFHFRQEKYKNMLNGERYYLGNHDILHRKKYGIGENEEQVELHHTPNYKIVDNQFKNMLDQKTNYVLSKPITISCENESYLEHINYIFDKTMLNTIFLLCKDAYKYGISWLYVYYDDKGELNYKIFDSKEIIPIWKDNEHNELDYIIRIYTHKYFDKNGYKERQNVEVYTINGIDYYTFENNKLISSGESKSYITLDNKQYSWSKIPIIPFKANEDETPLILNCKSIQDNINEVLSDFRNSIESNFMNNVFIVRGYNHEGGKFRKNLNSYGVINIHGNDSDVKVLSQDFNSEHYIQLLDNLKKSMISNCKGFDAKNDKIGSNPNQMNIQSMYSDIDLDANALEREFQKSFEELIWFIDQHLLLTKKGDFTNEKIEFIFNRDILINESQAIEDCLKSSSVLSLETILEQHPWITDVDIELNRLNKEKSENIIDYDFEIKNQLDTEDNIDDIRDNYE